MDLCFNGAPKDLMTKFVDCLTRLPNLRTLEIFGTSDVEPVTRGLKQKSAHFPGVRKLGISNTTAIFARNCPNVETITALPRISLEGSTILRSHGGELRNLKRVVGIAEKCVYLGEVEDML